MDNPFRYGSVVSGDHFTGREKELATLEMEMRSGQNVVIISPRRHGKTSLVFRAIDRLRRQGMLVAYFDMMAAPTKELLADGLADALYSGLGGVKDRALNRVREFFGRVSISPTVTLNPDGSQTFGVASSARDRETDAILKRLFELPEQVARDGRKVAVVLDEFQEAPALDPHLPALVRSVWQMQQNVSHVFLGSKRHMMTRLFTETNEPMFRMALPLVLGPISASNFANYIRERFVSTGIAIEDDAVKLILEITACHPGDTQELAHFTWALAATEKIPATRELVGRALVQVIQAEDSRYTILWDRLSPHQRLMLTALLGSGGASSIYSEAYRRRYRLGAPSSVNRSLTALMNSDLVEESPPGQYRIPDPFFRDWLSRLTKVGAGSVPPSIM
ncbi:MAG TPA: ATP-binding protein [Chloroflexota bacterium]|nr:ATP-binding protein [Chloroflexota bacterium]